MLAPPPQKCRDYTTAITFDVVKSATVSASCHLMRQALVSSDSCAVCVCSRRNSQWANAALVVAVQPSDWAHFDAQHGPLAGVALQVEAER